MEAIKAGFLGFNGQGQTLLEAASRHSGFTVEAVADSDTALAERTAKEYKCEAFDDYRQFIMQSKLDCVFVSAGLHECGEHVRMGLKKGFDIIKVAPPARDFEETAELLKLAQEKNVRFITASLRRFSDSFSMLTEHIEAGQITTPNFFTASCRTPHIERGDWQGDVKLAGGGVLLYDCFEMIEQITACFGMARQIFCFHTNQAEDHTQRLYRTEDTAALTMRFDDKLIGQLTASRTFGPSDFSLMVCTKEKVFTVSDDAFVITDPAGKVISRMDFEPDPVQWAQKFLDDYLLARRDGEYVPAYATDEENLAAMAVIESAYLSARTAMPEEPSKLVNINQTSRFLI
ncbi:MAG: Gfo/Idh/MocA family oxidoreductase [Phycisphaerae bacterium]|nr:Gfo/Idh/MocA family oxidoreductase [Phycisphaerae bacterium]